MSLLDSLPHTVDASYRVRTLDSMGGTKDSWTTLFTDKECWFQSASDKEITEFQKRGIEVIGKVYFNEDPGLDENHVLTIDGDLYEVVSGAVPDASVGLGKLWRVYVRRHTTGGTP